MVNCLLSMTLLMLSVLFLKGQRQVLNFAEYSLEVQGHLLSHNSEALMKFCQRSKENNQICHLKIKIRRKGQWQNFCSMSKREMGYWRKRYYFLEQNCKLLGKYFNFEDLFLF